MTVVIAELIHQSCGSLTHSALTRMVQKRTTDTVLNDETSEIKRDLCAFGSTGGGAQLLSNSSGNSVGCNNWLMTSLRFDCAEQNRANS